MFTNKWVLLSVGVLLGFMFSDRLMTVPFINKLPKL